MHLVDYKVRVVNGREGTAARVRVIIESRDKKDIWGTVFNLLTYLLVGPYLNDLAPEAFVAIVPPTAAVFSVG